MKCNTTPSQADNEIVSAILQKFLFSDFADAGIVDRYRQVVVHPEIRFRNFTS